MALRRLRSVFRVFRTATDCAALRALDATLRDVLSVLGPARDWDVFLGGIVREVEAAFPDDKRIAGLRRAAEAKRREAYAAVMAMLGGAPWRLLLLDAIECCWPGPGGTGRNRSGSRCWTRRSPRSAGR